MVETERGSRPNAPPADDTGVRAWQRIIAMATAVGCAVGLSMAQGSLALEESQPGAVARPSAAGRQVKVFGFNDRGPTPLPIEEWYRGQSAPEQGRERPGFPVWNGGFVDYDSPAFEGAASVKLPVQGGSTSIKLRNGVVPIFATADYLVTAMVRTAGLTHAGAVIEAWQVDEAGREIDSSRVRSPLVSGSRDWTPVGVELLGVDPDAAFVQIELLVLQPRELTDPSAAPEQYKIWDEDFSGAAWFDDVEVHQLPRIELKTANAGNTTRHPDRPVLEALVRDLAGERLRVEMTVTDLYGNSVDTYETVLDGGRLHEQWEPELGLFGWYRGVIRLRNQAGTTVGGARCDFLWMGPGHETLSLVSANGFPALGSTAGRRFGPGQEFGIEFLALPEPLLAALPEIIIASGSGAVTLPAWDHETDPAGQQRRVARLAPVLERLFANGVQVTLGFDRIPSPLARSTGIDPLDPYTLFAGETDLWRPYTEPYLDRFGQRVRRWQIGRAGDEPIRDETAESLVSISAELGRLVPGPIVSVPWQTEQAYPQALLEEGTRLSLSLPAGTGGEAMQMLAENWAAAQGTPSGSPSAQPREGLELTLQALAEEPFGQAAGPAEMVRRAVTALRHFGSPPGPPQRARPFRLTLVEPVNYSGRSRTPPSFGGPRQVSPSPALGAWAHLIERLDGRVVSGEITGLQGVRCYVLEPLPGSTEPRPGALVVWRDRATTRSTTLRMNLGEGDVRVLDLFGNPSPATRQDVGDRQRPEHVIEIGEEPRYIEGVDVGLVQFQSSIRLSPDLVEVRNVVHQHELVMDNPWDVPIRGRAFLLEPGGFSVPGGEVDRRWEISPRVIEFAIPALGQTRLPLSIETSAGTPAGPQPLVLDIELSGSRSYGVIRARRGFELGLPELGLRVYYRVGSDENPADVFLEAEVTNLGDATMNLQLDSVVPGFPRGKATVSGLKPGETVLRTFPLPGAYDTARGVRAAVSLTDADGSNGARLIKAVTID